MKTMKRMAALLLVLAMVLTLAACGGSEKTLKMRGDLTSDMSGIPTTDTWTIVAKGDTVQTVTEVMEMDLSDYEDNINDVVELFASAIKTPAEGIDGVTCTDRVEGTTYIIELTVNCTGDTVSKAIDAGILQIEGSSDRISLKQTQKSLENQGYEVID